MDVTGGGFASLRTEARRDAGLQLLLQFRAELRQPRHALLDNLVARGVAEAKVALGAEGRAGHHRDLLLFEQLGAEINVLHPETADLRQNIEPPAADHTAHTGNP